MSVGRPIALLLDIIALALCLFAFLIKPHVASLVIALGFAAAVFAMIAPQRRWVAIVAAVFCILVAAVCSVVGIEIWRTGDWYGSEAGKIQFFASIGLLGSVGPLLTLYVLFRMYATPGGAEVQSEGL